MIRWTRIFKEDIYGNKAIVYHRTNVKNLINKVYTSGFKPSINGMYGKGFYSTYDLKSQLNPGMVDLYGNIIVKFVVNSLEKFFILEYKEFLKSPVGRKLKSSKENFIKDQLKYFGIKDVPEDINLDIENYKYSSDLAEQIYETLLKNKNIYGLIFKSPNDGNVLAAYNVNILLPISFSLDEGETWKKSEKKNLEYLQKVFNQSSVIDNSLDKKYKSVIVNDKKSNGRYIEKKFYWLKDADFEDAEIKVINEQIIWLNGTWLSGVWENGKWFKGKWKSGMWLNGEVYIPSLKQYVISKIDPVRTLKKYTK